MRLPSGKDSPVEPIPLEEESRFDFACHRGLACYTDCCRGIEITLSPYDVLRLSRRLGLATGAFLDRHARSATHGPSGLPLVVLRMGDDERRSCPFVSPDGCTVYGDRPALCRSYPVGIAAYALSKGGEGRRQLERATFLVREEHCLGHREPRVWSAADWLEAEGATEYDEANRDWLEALLRRPPQDEPADERRRVLVHLACYDLDRFRDFVFRSPFLGQFEVDPAEVEAMRREDRALLGFALRFVKWLLGVEETMRLRPEAAEAWRARRGGTPPAGVS